jgi:hypothetical protein
MFSDSDLVKGVIIAILEFYCCEMSYCLFALSHYFHYSTAFLGFSSLFFILITSFGIWRS